MVCSIAQTKVETIFATSHDVHKESALATFFATPRCVQSIQFDSDVLFDQDEFFYLLGFKSADEVSWQMLAAGIETFFKKQKFCSIVVVLEYDQANVSLSFSFSSYWTFSRLKMKGFFVGKEVYRQFYLMDSGDIFDQQKHHESVAKIKQALTKDGYFKAHVTTDFERNHATKTIVVCLTVTRSEKYTLEHRACILEGDIDQEEKDDLARVLKKNFLRRLSGAYYNKEKLNNAGHEIKRFLADKGFLHTTICLDEHFIHAEKRVELAWRINVHSKRQLVFFGNTFFTHRQLCEKITQFGRSAWLLPATILSEEIVRSYQKKGFCDVQIEAKEQPDRSFFIIKEGKRFCVDAIELKNVEQFDCAHLVRKFFKKIIKRRFFDYDLLQACLADLIRFYSQHGYLDAAVLGHECVVDGSGRQTLVISIEQGACYQLGSVRIENYNSISENDLFLPRENWQEDVFFDPMLVARQRQFLIADMRKNGCLHCAPRPQVTKKGSQVDIVWHIEQEQKPVSFGKTVVLGSCPLPFKHVQNMLLFQSGSPWNQNIVRTSFNFLRGLDVFESIQLIPDIANGASDNRDVLLKFEHDDPFELRVRVGAELQHVRHYRTLEGITYRLGGSFMIKNPFERADHFRFDVDMTRAHREIVANYIRPWMLKVPARVVSKVYSIKHDQPGYVGGNKNLYTTLQHGGLASFQAGTQWVDIACNVGFEWMKTSIKDDSIATKVQADQLARAINYDSRLLGKTIPYIMFEPTIFLDRLDNKLNPTQGTLTLLSLKGMFPLGGPKPNSLFVKMLLEHSLFIPIKKLVCAIRARVGHIFYKEFAAIAPIERFYLGGSHSLRGYDTDLAPPVSVFTDAWGKEYVVPRGGKSMININAELRIPLANQLGLVLFQDAGLLSKDNFADFSTNNMLAATGFGVRYNTPIGPLRFDIGWKWLKRVPSERSFAWFLSLGHAF